MKRRTLWQIAVVLVLAAVGGMAAVSVLATPTGDRAMAIQTRRLPDVSRHDIPRDIHPATSNGLVPRAIWLVRTPDGWRAFTARSNHLGCPVEWVAKWERLVDQCSGAAWDRTGLNVAGPAPRPLDSYPVKRLEHGWVEVDLSRLVQ
ncbi:MAG TPA: hypothetical protein VD902_18070 [Symbiobacteriaceae bacterium]|nr:hypothetical protein [Symbiobacteriaceae bacterium]